MAGFLRMRNFRAIQRIMPATAFELASPELLRDRYPRDNGNVTEYPLSNENCTRFWGMSLLGILPDGTYDKGLGLMKPYPWEPEPVKPKDKKKRREHADDGSSDGYEEETGKDSRDGSSLENGEGPSDWWRMSIPKDNDKKSSLDDDERASKWWKTGYSIVSGESICPVCDMKFCRDQGQGKIECEEKKKKWHFKRLWRRMPDHRLLSNDKGKGIDLTYQWRHFCRDLRCKKVEPWMPAQPIPVVSHELPPSPPPSDEVDNNVEEIGEEESVDSPERFAPLNLRMKVPFPLSDSEPDSEGS